MAAPSTSCCISVRSRRAGTPDKPLMADRILYRAHSPRYAFAPLSGAGAASTGGRWNAPGHSALYLSTDPTTAMLEAQQDVDIFSPVTLVSYALSDARIFETAATNEVDYEFDSAVLATVWQDHVIDGTTAPTWDLAGRLKKQGFHGLLYASRLNGAQNLVLWSWNEVGGARLRTLDPFNRLPRDDASWR